jgi:hypothetical protein
MGGSEENARKTKRQQTEKNKVMKAKKNTGTQIKRKSNKTNTNKVAKR